MRKKILIIDDSKDLSEVLKYRLKHEGYDVLTASTGIEGTKKAVYKQPDLILLDVYLPKLEGFNICKSLKENVLTNQIKIIIMSGQARETGQAMNEIVHSDAYVYKPFDLESLIKQVDEVLTRK